MPPNAKLIRIGFAVVCLLSCFSAARSQGVGAAGELNGRITDPNRAAVKAARITATASETGLQRTTLSSESGEYLLPNLAPATYEIQVSFQGFETAVKKGLLITVGETVIADFQLSVAQVSAQLDVLWEPPAVDTQRGSQANTITERYIRNLPIDRRDYLTYALLAPGVSDSRRLTDNTEFRVKQTPQSGLSVYGSNGRGNSVTVDGGEANDNTGGVLPTLSQEAVQEFQINRSNYAAELGGASGASINVVSKTGTNDLHGSAFGYFRNDALDARDPFAFTSALPPAAVNDPSKFSLTATATPIKPNLNRQQFGGSISFPIKKDQTFLFAAYEGLRRNEQNSVPLLTDSSIFAPTAGKPGQTSNQLAILNGLRALGNTPVTCTAAQVVVPASVCAAQLTQTLTINPAASQLKAFWVSQFIHNSGVFPFKSVSNLASARLSHQFDSHDQSFIRYNFGRVLEQNPNVQALIGASHGTHVDYPFTHTLMAAWFHEFSATTVNELRGQYIDYKFNVIPIDPGGPQLEVNGFGVFNRNVSLPSLAHGKRYEFADNLTLLRGRHHLKAGVYLLLRGTDSDSHIFFPGRFFFGDLPGALVSPCLSAPTSCGLPANIAPATLNALQSAALGLPSFYQQGFGSGKIQSTNPLVAGYWQDAWSIKPGLTLNYGLRYEFDKRYAPLQTDGNNFAPRFSLSWDPWQDHKTVVRAGYGLFYAPIYFQIDAAINYLGVIDRRNGNHVVTNLSSCATGTDCFRQISQVMVQLNGVPGGPPSTTSQSIFQTLFAQGKINCGTPPAGAEACITPADLTQFGINITHNGPIPPLAVLFGGAPDYRNTYSEQAEFGIERDLGKEFSLALSYIHVRTLHIPRARDKNLKPAPFAPTGPNNVPVRRWNGPGCAGALVVNCFFNPLLLQDNVYESQASATYDGGIIELTKRWGRRSSLFANYTWSKALDEVTDFNSDFQPNDQIDIRAERALSPFDQRHKVVIAAVFTAPAQTGAKASWPQRVVKGFSLSPSFRANSGRPFNLLAGTDINGDRHSTSDRPPGAGRNAGHGPSFWTFDLRLMREFQLNEKLRLQVLGEGFNLLNHTNFLVVNNVVGPNFTAPFAVEGRRDRAPNEPLGFAAAYPMRQIQFGARLIF